MAEKFAEKLGLPERIKMKNIKLLSFVFAFLITTPLLVYAQGAGIEWDTLNKRVLELGREGQYDRAIVLAKKALEIAEENVGQNHPDVATSLNNLAELYRAKADYDKAEPLYKRALAINEKAFGPDHPNVAPILNNLAELYNAKADYDKAEPLYKRALAINEKALGPDHPKVAETLENLAKLYRATKRTTEAKELEKRAAKIKASKK